MLHHGGWHCPRVQSTQGTSSGLPTCGGQNRGQYLLVKKCSKLAILDQTNKDHNTEYPNGIKITFYCIACMIFFKGSLGSKPLRKSEKSSS